VPLIVPPSPHPPPAVNFYGRVRCCKAFLPLLKDQAVYRPEFTYDGARIVNVTSTAGLVSGPIGFGSYCSSKFAAQAFSQCLRGEVWRPFSVQVATVNPSFHRTSIVTKARERHATYWGRLPAELRDQEYGDGTEAYVALCQSPLLSYRRPPSMFSHLLVVV